MAHNSMFYRYSRVGHDQRLLELKVDGSIGVGNGDAEKSWRIFTVEGEPTLSISGDHGEICCLRADQNGIWRGQWLQFEKMRVELTPEPDPPLAYQPNAAESSVRRESRPPDLANNHRPRFPGRYVIRRVFQDQQTLELLPDGSVSTDGIEVATRWFSNGEFLELSDDHGLVCRLAEHGDGVWRGIANDSNRLPVELYPAGVYLPPMPSGWTTFKYPEIPGFWWSNYECLGQAVRKLCRQLPPLRAVTGIPRSGIIPASLIAQWQNIPLLDIDEALVANPRIPSFRRRSSDDLDDSLPILIVDDTISSGRTLSWYRSRAMGKGKYLFAAPYVDAQCRGMVDFYGEVHLRSLLAFEWNLLHEVSHTQATLCDLDGVICEDWTGGMEEEHPDAYQRHLYYGKPLRIPTKPILGVVTGRMHIYRDQTEAWLRKHKVQYKHLWMLPAATEIERGQIGAGNFKARIYNESGAGLFVESCPHQAKQIHELTGKPVIDFSSMTCHGATVVR